MGGLNYPSDLGAWRAWQDRQHLLRRLRHLRSGEEPRAELHLTSSGPRPKVLVALDATTPTKNAALLRPASLLPQDDVAYLSIAPMSGSAPFVPDDVAVLQGVRAVLAAGHFLPAGAAAYELSRQRGWDFFIAQHGLLTPFVPPLATGARVLAWSAADGQFWSSGRSDVSYEVVGSQLLEEASRATVRAGAGQGSEPVYLGQLHAAEMRRSRLAIAAPRFCRVTGALYRPHPSEADAVSRAIHAAWARAGVRFEDSGRPLVELGRPVVSVFSTGVLEAAAQGLPAWVELPRPPAGLSR